MIGYENMEIHSNYERFQKVSYRVRTSQDKIRLARHHFTVIYVLNNPIKPQDPAIENKYFFESNVERYEYHSDVPQTDSRITLRTTPVALKKSENSAQIKGNQWKGEKKKQDERKGTEGEKNKNW